MKNDLYLIFDISSILCIGSGVMYYLIDKEKILLLLMGFMCCFYFVTRRCKK